MAVLGRSVATTPLRLPFRERYGGLRYYVPTFLPSCPLPTPPLCSILPRPDGRLDVPGGNLLSLSRQTAYGQIADALRAAILAGDYEPTEEDPTRNELPGAVELGAKYGVSDKTAARAVQQLIAEGLVIGRPGLRPLVVPRKQRPDRWPMNRRYARAREAGGLVFGSDMLGREVTKRITHTGWMVVPHSVVPLLRLGLGDRVWARARELLIDSRIAELSVSSFPAESCGCLRMSAIVFSARPTRPGLAWPPRRSCGPSAPIPRSSRSPAEW